MNAIKKCEIKTDVVIWNQIRFWKPSGKDILDNADSYIKEIIDTNVFRNVSLPTQNVIIQPTHQQLESAFNSLP
jgi:hypothetical protein